MSSQQRRRATSAAGAGRQRRSGRENGLSERSRRPLVVPGEVPGASDPLVQISPSWASFATGRKKPRIGPDRRFLLAPRRRPFQSGLIYTRA